MCVELGHPSHFFYSFTVLRVGLSPFLGSKHSLGLLLFLLRKSSASEESDGPAKAH